MTLEEPYHCQHAEEEPETPQGQCLKVSEVLLYFSIIIPNFKDSKP